MQVFIIKLMDARPVRAGTLKSRLPLEKVAWEGGSFVQAVNYADLKQENMDPNNREVHAFIAGLFDREAVWFSSEWANHLTHLAPFAIRDPSCRKHFNKHREEWGTVDQNGYMRDDNTLVKNWVKGLNIDDRAFGTVLPPLTKGYTACHLWRGVADGRNVMQKNYHYSAICNLVWLPTAYSRLSDQEGSFAQTYLKAIALGIFPHRQSGAAGLRRFYESVDLDQTAHDIQRFGIDTAGLRLKARRYFIVSATKLAWHDRKMRSIRSQLVGRATEVAVRPRRFREGLSALSAGRRERLLKDLEQYALVKA
jgi:hypothetical protein